MRNEILQSFRFLVACLLLGGFFSTAMAQEKSKNLFIAVGLQAYMSTPTSFFSKTSPYRVRGRFNLDKMFMFTANAFGEHTVGMGLSFSGLDLRKDLRKWLFYYANDNIYIRLERDSFDLSIEGLDLQQSTYGHSFRAQLIFFSKHWFSHGPMYMIYEMPVRYAYHIKEEIGSGSYDDVSYTYYDSYSSIASSEKSTEYDDYMLYAIDPRARYRVYGYAPIFADVMLMTLRNGSLPNSFGIKTSDSFGVYIDGRVVVGLATLSPSPGFADDLHDAEVHSKFDTGSVFVVLISELQGFMLFRPSPQYLIKLGVWNNNFSSFYANEADGLVLHWGPRLEVGGRF